MGSLRESDVLIDLCTQKDYLCDAGRRPAANADSALTHIKHLMGWARWSKLPVVSAVDELPPERALSESPPPCVLGTPGQHKVSYTLLPDHTRVESDNCLCVSLDILREHQQAIFSKRHRDPMTIPKLDRLLTEMPAKRFVVFGVALDTCMRPLVLGLLLRGRNVVVVGDACAYWSEVEAQFCERQILAKGCSVVTTRQFLHESWVSQKRPRGVRMSHKRFVA
jgi:nicotinamidase-related amidase